MKLGLVTYTPAPENLEICTRVEAAAGDVEIFYSEAAASSPERPATELRDLDVDVIIAVGGDGTMLRTLGNTQAPVLGVNTGRMGFLTQVDPKHLEVALAKILSGSFGVKRRLRLGVARNEERLGDCVNDAVVHTRRIGQLNTYNIELENQVIDSLRADGLVIATPVGSTSYAMSAGGPLLDPAVDAFVVVPLAPYQLGSRPFVVPADAEIVVTSPDAAGNELILDGQSGALIGPDDRVVLSRSEVSANFVDMGPGFYEKIHRKLRRGG